MSKQVFQTDSRRRWMRFKWTMRFFATIIALLLIVFVTMFFMEGSPGMPFRRLSWGDVSFETIVARYEVVEDLSLATR